MVSAESATFEAAASKMIAVASRSAKGWRRKRALLYNRYNKICYLIVFHLMDMNVYAVMPPSDVAADLANRLKARRLARNLTQDGLARRSGVALGTLKKFERTGAISLVSFVRLVIALGEEAALERLMANPEFETLDQVLSVTKMRKRGRHT
ncbi:MAG: helix-turn-helix transcriptional regulator [Gammaproteobacteria bacterium]|nr:helix-turn-helix transcriptional regulator [Gammaproteobacteria bacterium]